MRLSPASLDARNEVWSTGVEDDGDSRGELLLDDIRAIFEANGATRLKTEALLEALNAREGHPWAEASHGRPLTATGLAALLGPFGIRPSSVRIRSATPKGYMLDWFADAFSRYVPRRAATAATREIREKSRAKHRA